jgi:hypothetical protein
LGVYPGVSLKDAREQATEARKVLQAGGDPGDVRKAGKAQAAHEAVNTLETVADEWLRHQSARWEPLTMQRIRASLAADIFPALGARPLASIKPGEIMAAVKLIEKRGAAVLASRVLHRIEPHA